MFVYVNCVNNIDDINKNFFSQMLDCLSIYFTESQSKTPGSLTER